MQSYAACADPEIQAHVRERFADARAPGARARRAPRRPSCGRSSPTGCCSTSSRRSTSRRSRRARSGRPAGSSRSTMLEAVADPRLTMLDRLAALIYRRRRRFLWGSLGGGARRRLLRRPGVRAARLGRRLRRPAGRGGRWRARHRRAPTGAQRGARHRRARAARRAGRLGAGAGASSTASRRALEDRGVASVRPLRARRRPRARLEGRPLDLRAGDLPRRTPAGALDRVAGRGSSACPGVTLGGGDVAARPGRRPGVGGHRARRAARLPDPLPALAVRLPQRSSPRCSRSRSAAPRSCSRSS